MGGDLMSYLSHAFSWGGEATTKHGTTFDGGVEGAAGTMHPTSTGNDLLGGMVGGFGFPMEWKGAGFGAGAGGSVTGRDGGYVGGDAGLGFGAGYSTWGGNQAGKQMDGASVAAGGVAPVGGFFGNDNFGVDASTNFYSGVGSSAYTYSKGTDQGAGVSSSVVPLGAADTNVGLSTDYGSANAHADNLYAGKLSGSGTFGQDGSTYHGDGAASFGFGGTGINANVDTPIGSANAGAGSINYGTGVNLGGSYDTATGAANVHGGFNDGFTANNVSAGYSVGPVSESASADKVTYGVQGQGAANWDPSTGTFTATGSGSGGGFNAQGVKVNESIDGVGSISGTAGEISNDIQAKDLSAVVDANHAQFGGSLDGGGFRVNNADVNADVGGVTANAHAGTFANTNSITKATFGANWSDPNNPSLNAGFEDLSVGSFWGNDLGASINGPGGSNAKAHVDSFTTGFDAKNFSATYDNNGLNANLGTFNYADVGVKGVDASTNIPGVLNSSAHIGEAASDRVAVSNAHLDASLDTGIHASADKASYDEVYLNDVHASQNVGDGLYKSQLDLGDGSFNHASADKIHAGLDSNGLDLGLQNGQYGFLQGNGINLQTSVGDGAVGVGASADQASLGTVNVGSLDYNTTLESSHLNVNNLDAAAWKSKNINVNANVGDLGAGVGAQTLNVGDLSVGNAHADTSNFGLTGNAGVTNANFDALNVKGGHAGLSWGGDEVLGASGDFRSGAGVGSANANWDVTSGTAAANFKDASFGSQLNNANVNLFGTNVALPDMGYKVNASGGGNVDLSQGAANANLSLGGSSANFAGYEFTVPDWVQGSAGVNLSQGAANINVGGQNGIGADVNLSKGDFKLDAFGYEADIGQGVRDVGGAISDGAHAVGGAISDGASAVGGAVSDGWNAVTDW